MSQWQRALGMSFLVALALVLLTSLGWSDSGGDQAAADRVLVQGKDFRITKKELDAKVMNLPMSVREYSASEEGKEHVLKELVRIEVFASEARADEMEKNAAFQTKLQQVTKALLAEEYAKRKILNQFVDDEEAKRYFQEHQDEFKLPERIKAPYIFVSVPPGSAQQVWKEKETKAKKTRARAQKGEDFAKLIMEVSDSDEKDDWDYFQRGRLTPQIEEDVFRLKKGEISPIFRTHAGFLMYKLEDRLPESVPPFAEAACQVKDILLKEKSKKAFEEMEKKLYAKYGVVFSQASATGSVKNPEPANHPQGNPLTGKITRLNLLPAADQGRLLGTILLEEVSGKGMADSKASVDLTPRTSFLKKTPEGKQAATVGDLQMGQWVEVTTTGAALQSFPIQVEAVAIVILPAKP